MEICSIKRTYMYSIPVRKPLRFPIFLSCCLLAFVACKTDKPCKYKPEPIFEKGQPHIVQYNFERQGAQSLESLLLDSGVLLEIGQDVCNSSRQEYRFMVKGDYAQYPDSLWIREASRQLVYLSAVSPKQAPLKAWADVIEQNRSKMKLGEDLIVQAGISVRVDKVISTGESTLVLLFTQE